MKKLIIIVALMFSVSATAQKFSPKYWINDPINDQPAVQSSNNDAAFAAISGCEETQLQIFDFNLPSMELNSEFSGKLRVDAKPIKTFSASFYLFEDIPRMSLTITKLFLTELKEGKTLRIQWALRNGDSFVEEYSLTGFTKTYNIFMQGCDAAHPDWFKSKDGKEYFRS
tara:strand:+ start:639 stop:1148 length:510 start_codon:yes stop_codon:yes gene_type:complete